MAEISRRKLANYAATRLADGTSSDDVVKELAAYLVSTKRTSEVDLIIRDIETALARRGIVVAEVFSARELSSATQKVITDYVQQQTQAEQVVLSSAIDQSLIGGMTVSFAGKQLDTTIKKKLETLTAQQTERT